MDEYGCDVSENVCRIVLCSVAYIVYDMMTIEVHDYKTELSRNDQGHQADCSSASDSSSSSSTIHPCESNVSLLRYGGFALHSLIQKYHNGPWQHDNVISLLKKKPESAASVPYAIECLNQGRLVIIDPCMLPYIRLLVEKVMSHVNDDQCKQAGQHVIKVARKKIEIDVEIREAFMSCVEHCNVTPSNSTMSTITRVYEEMTLKIFHARVNEYMTASVEMELEKSGKAVKADQSLRDELKTYSSNQ